MMRAIKKRKYHICRTSKLDFKGHVLDFAFCGTSSWEVKPDEIQEVPGSLIDCKSCIKSLTASVRDSCISDELTVASALISADWHEENDPRSPWKWMELRMWAELHTA